MPVNNYHLFVGSDIGALKGVNIIKGTFTNINSISGLNNNEGITAMCWEDNQENKVYTGQNNQVVRTYDCETQAYTTANDLQVGEGPIKGLCRFNGHLVTAVESGIVKIWNEKESEEHEINTGGNLCKMIQNPFSNFQIATGGKENDLKIWDMQTPEVPIFKAKNVRNDFLDLRVPVWITDMKFISVDSVITCTRHHQMRLYDTRAQKRPVIDMDFERWPLMSLSLAHNNNQVVVGSSRGRMALVDLRKKLLIHVFKGFAGSIRCVQCHPTLPLVASCGLDRFLRIHELNQHKLLKKIYLKSKLNCLLFKTNLETSVDTMQKNSKETIVKKAVTFEKDDDENLWSSMEIVSEPKKNKHMKHHAEATPAKKKKILEIQDLDDSQYPVVTSINKQRSEGEEEREVLDHEMKSESDLMNEDEEEGESEDYSEEEEKEEIDEECNSEDYSEEEEEEEIDEERSMANYKFPSFSLTSMFMTCRSIRIGSIKLFPKPNAKSIRVNLSPEGFSFTAVPFTDKMPGRWSVKYKDVLVGNYGISLDGNSIDITLKAAETLSAWIHFGKGLPVIFAFTNKNFCETVKKTLHMLKSNPALFDPTSDDVKTNKVTFLIDNLIQPQRNFLRHVFPGQKRLKVIDRKEAHEMLLKSRPAAI